MVWKYRDTALQELKKMSDDLDKELAADTQQDKLNSLLRLRDRSQRALSSVCDTEVLKVEKDMTAGGGSSERLKELEAGLSDTSYRPGLHGEFTNDIEDYIKRYIGSPVKLQFPTEDNFDIIRVGRCGDEERREVISLRQSEDEVIEAYCGGPGGGVTKVEQSAFDIKDNKTIGRRYEIRIACVTRKIYIWEWKTPGQRYFGSKGERMRAIFLDCSTGRCQIYSLHIKQDKGEENCTWGTVIVNPKLHNIHNFDSNKQKVFFALVDEDEDKTASNESEIRNEKSKTGSRVVRLYSNKSKEPIATYTSPIQPFFPTDVCFHGEDLLLITDWMNDSVHVVKVTDNDLKFISYLPGSGDIVRPTALNLDLQDRLLIGCGNGWILKYSVDI